MNASGHKQVQTKAGLHPKASVRNSLESSIKMYEAIKNKRKKILKAQKPMNIGISSGEVATGKYCK